MSNADMIFMGILMVLNAVSLYVIIKLVRRNKTLVKDMNEMVNANLDSKFNIMWHGKEAEDEI
jgi:hypothetical protein